MSLQCYDDLFINSLDPFLNQLIEDTKQVAANSGPTGRLYEGNVGSLGNLRDWLGGISDKPRNPQIRALWDCQALRPGGNSRSKPFQPGPNQKRLFDSVGVPPNEILQGQQFLDELVALGVDDLIEGLAEERTKGTEQLAAREKEIVSEADQRVRDAEREKDRLQVELDALRDVLAEKERLLGRARALESGKVQTKRVARKVVKKKTASAAKE